jgi:copper(I)-binding protein
LKAPAPALTILARQAAGQEAGSQSVKAGALIIEAPWIRATPGGAKIAGGYMKITNTGKETDRLIGGTLAAAGRFEVHEMSMEGGVMKMRHLPKGLEIKPGESVEFKPGGYHVMFMDLKQGLKEGATVKGTLVFEKAGKIEVEYKIGPIGGGAPAAGGHSHH